eukprot:1160842-Pelagomonas_calceolata.AAC.6
MRDMPEYARHVSESANELNCCCILLASERVLMEAFLSTIQQLLVIKYHITFQALSTSFPVQPCPPWRPQPLSSSSLSVSLHNKRASLWLRPGVGGFKKVTPMKCYGWVCPQWQLWSVNVGGNV